MSAAALALVASRWYRASYRDDAPRFFQALDDAEARLIARHALDLRSVAGIVLAQIDADEQPELIFSGVVVDQECNVDPQAKRRITIYIARGL